MIKLNDKVGKYSSTMKYKYKSKAITQCAAHDRVEKCHKDAENEQNG